MNDSTFDSPSIALGKDDIRITSEPNLILKGIICFESGEITEAISWFDKAINSESNAKTVAHIVNRSIPYHYRGLCYCLLVELCPNLSHQEREHYLNMAKSDFNHLSNLTDDRISASQRFFDDLAPITSI